MYNLEMITRRIVVAMLPFILWTGCSHRNGAPAPVMPEVVVPGISVMDLKAFIDAGEEHFILDVRTPEEYDGPLGHLEGSYLIPVQELAGRLGELENVKDRKVYLVCRSGGRSASATRLLLEAGFDAYNLEGGMLAWEAMMHRETEMMEEVVE